MNGENLDKIVEMHYRLQYGCFFNQVLVHDGILYAWNDVMECFIWNHVFPLRLNELSIDEVVCQSKKYLSSRGRKPCIYIEDKHNSNTSSLLNEAGFQCVDNEAWMLYCANDTSIINSHIVQCQKVSSKEELESFCTVCSECFDPQYSSAIRREFEQHQPHKNVCHFIYCKDNIAVASASVYEDSGYYFIHNVGVLPKYRKCGIAKQIMAFVINTIITKATKPSIVLQCDGGGFVEDFYSKLGFQTIYRRWGYVLDEQKKYPGTV